MEEQKIKKPRKQKTIKEESKDVMKEEKKSKKKEPKSQLPVFEKSKNKKYKYEVITPSGKKVYFGDAKYKHFKDSTGKGEWTHMDHNDQKR